MQLDQYHQQYADKSDDELAKRLAEKKDELERVVAAVGTQLSGDIHVAVMGCGDARFVDGHQTIFSEVFGAPATIFTFDITIDHLAGKEGVTQHDCTEPLPGGPYQISYAHVLLRFIPEEQQYAVVQNSIDCLADNGLAIHVLDPDDYEEGGKVAYESILKQLGEADIDYTEVSLNIGKALVVKKTR
ncbi:hypothetical protein KC973_02250 [Candidatus Saccharibacteria bacterium]|nr:hypothetical protein [Candidatus Saccharibacteria bacterium]